MDYDLVEKTPGEVIVYNDTMNRYEFWLDGTRKFSTWDLDLLKTTHPNAKLINCD